MPRWKDSRALKLENSQPCTNIPEPLHRISGVGSGISLRSLPKPTVMLIQQACFHYEKKCAGKYDAKSVAARYVFQLSREVQGLLSSIQNDINEKERKLCFLENSMKEWDEHFGPLRNLRPDILVDEKNSHKHVIHKISGSQEYQLGDKVELISPFRLKMMIDDYVEAICRLKKELNEQKALLQTRDAEYEVKLRDDRVVNNNHLRSEATYLERMFEQKKDDIEKSHLLQVEKLMKIQQEKDIRIEQLEQQLEDQRRSSGSMKIDLNRMDSHNQELQKEVSKYKKKSDQNWNYLVGKAQEQVVEQHKIHVNNLLQQIENMRRKQQLEEQASSKKQMQYELDHMKPLQRKLAEQNETGKDIEAENYYLRNRVKELNRIVAALQCVVKG